MLSLFIINPLSILITLSTLLGVVVHDTKVDQLATKVLSVPNAIVNYEGVNHAIKFSDEHTHTERISLSEVVRSVNSDVPRIQPRMTSDKKYRLQKNVVRGHHAFDNYSLPILAA